MSSPKVSIIMPSLNVRPYIEQCIKSVVDQSLKEIEIICVDAGSTDGTLEILKKYEKQDSRVHVILSKKRSYGYQMDLGIEYATGKYIGIVETDDFVESNMFEFLYEIAEQDNLDVVKSGFFSYYENNIEKNIKVCLKKELIEKGVIEDGIISLSIDEQLKYFSTCASIWSAIYNRRFLEENKINFTETPGASFQDTGFDFKVKMCAKRMRFVKECFIHYRRDNEQSSAHSSNKVFCICDEFEEIKCFIKKNAPDYVAIKGLYARVKYNGYHWNFDRIDKKFKWDFLVRVSKEYKQDIKEGFYVKDYFDKKMQIRFMVMAYIPVLYFIKKAFELIATIN